MQNKIIISTKSFSNDDKFKDFLENKGAIVYNFPLIETVKVEITQNLIETLKEINSFNWIIFTSKNGVEKFFSLLNDLNIKLLTTRFTKFAAIGNRTADELEKNSIEANFISTEMNSEKFVLEMSDEILCKGDKVLLALGNLANDTLENGLKQTTEVHRINVYKTHSTINHQPDIIDRLIADNYDLLIFTSPSGFESFLSVCDKYSIRNINKIACIGNTTAQAIINSGYKPKLISPKSDAETFVDSIETYFNDNFANFINN
ncbi:MAG: uroporphyrinogen-III synthase [Candidatus Kapabacteria bacterium]|nr:uroporphyrinogen-III synthase [Candidatus Kapabacteria bacterium]